MILTGNHHSPAHLGLYADYTGDPRAAAYINWAPGMPHPGQAFAQRRRRRLGALGFEDIYGGWPASDPAWDWGNSPSAPVYTGQPAGSSLEKIANTVGDWFTKAAMIEASKQQKPPMMAPLAVGGVPVRTVMLGGAALLALAAFGKIAKFY